MTNTPDPATLGPRPEADPTAAATLDTAWAHLMESFELARAALSDPAYFPPVATDRNVADGHRYLLGHLHRLIETETHQDPMRPGFQRHPWSMSKYTIENPDNLYLYSPVDPDEHYRVTGRAAATDHWTGQRDPDTPGPLAPHYVIIELHQMAPGDSGALDEMFDGRRDIVDHLDSTDLTVDADGRFEIHIGPVRPDGWSGPFLQTRFATSDGEKVATKLYIREVFGNWDTEVSLDLDIARVGAEGQPALVRTAKVTAEQIESLGTTLVNQVRFWNLMYGSFLDPYSERDEPVMGNLPRNGINQPKAAAAETGGGQATNMFGAGLFDLTDDTALLIEVDLGARPPQYFGCHLGNFWGEALDYSHHQSCVNSLQAAVDDDGFIRLVVSKSDPGVANWLDTCGHLRGYVVSRSTYSEEISAEDRPRLLARVVRLVDLAAQLPSSTRYVTQAERQVAVEARRLHVARRYRQW